MPALGDKALLAWVRHVSEHATWMASTCTGASIYAAAGLLAGRRAITHWAFRDVLASMGVNVCPDRVVFDKPFVSGAGVSAGIDMALALTGQVHGPAVAEAIQLVIEYDPQPPFDRRRTTQGKRSSQASSGHNARGRRLPMTTPRPASSRERQSAWAAQLVRLGAQPVVQGLRYGGPDGEVPAVLVLFRPGLPPNRTCPFSGHPALR